MAARGGTGAGGGGLGTGPGEKSREDARTATFWRTVGVGGTPVSLANASIVASGRGAVVLPHRQSPEGRVTPARPDAAFGASCDRPDRLPFIVQVLQ